jgi:hypothetical protein
VELLRSVKWRGRDFNHSYKVVGADGGLYSEKEGLDLGTNFEEIFIAASLALNRS